MEHQGEQRNPDNEIPTCSEQRDERIMGQLRDAILDRVAAGSNPSEAESRREQLRSYIEEKLRGFFPNFDTPSHPPYASIKANLQMIQRAIEHLNEEGGSSEESISGCIRKENEDLPWHHEALLSHHLRKLCRTGEIVLTNNGRYVIVVEHDDVGDRKEMGYRMKRRGRQKPRKRQFRDELQRQLKEKVGKNINLMKQDNEEECQAEGQEMKVIDEWNKVKEGQIEVLKNQCKVKEQAVEERNEASRQYIEATNRQIEGPSVELNDEEQYNPQYLQIEVLEEPSHLQELLSEASEKHTLACKRKNVVVLKLNKPQKPQNEVVNDTKKDDQLTVTIPIVSETTSQCLDCNGISHSLEEPCMQLMKKKTEFQEKLMENSHSLGRSELSKYDTAGPVMEEEKKNCLEVEQQRTKSSLTESETSIEVIEAHSKLQHQEDGLLLREGNQPLQNHIEITTEVMGLCCFKEVGISENFRVPLGESHFIVKKDERTKCLVQKQHKEQRKIICGERKFTIICGLQAQKLSEPKIYGQRRACKSDPYYADKLQSPGQAMSLSLPKPDTVRNMRELLVSEHRHDDEQHKPKHGQGQARNLLKLKFNGQWRACKSDLENDQQHQSPGQAKSLPRPKPDTDTTMSELLPSDYHHDDEQHQPKDQGQGQAPDLSKSKFYGQQRACKSDAENDQQHQSPGQAKSFSRPKPDTDITMSDLLPSDQHHNDEQHQSEGKGQGQGRLQKAEGGRDFHDHDGLRVFVRHKHKSLRTYVRRKRNA
ncbi:hypothetical protein JRO89_XS05G0234500 [Xanthoceras sorbifolium]|uniref:H15 domain-containing protein n=1 Tax=Xanthoceras sorbifolium TaxID=99658 RepID=A0ABQ8I300_9ROSI|nr:hypothetical protein JRO89_XS05G0234500 [Xanthoceras sorbifolium]